MPNTYTEYEWARVDHRFWHEPISEITKTVSMSRTTLNKRRIKLKIPVFKPELKTKPLTPEQIQHAMDEWK